MVDNDRTILFLALKNVAIAEDLFRFPYTCPDKRFQA